MAYNHFVPAPARGLVSAVRRLTRYNNPEIKHYRYYANDYIWTDNLPVAMEAINMGPTNAQRIGSSIKFTRISFKWRFNFSLLEEPACTLMRVIIFRNNWQRDGITPTSSMLLEHADSQFDRMFSPYNRDTPRRFTILYDKRVKCDKDYLSPCFVYNRPVSFHQKYAELVPQEPGTWPTGTGDDQIDTQVYFMVFVLQESRPGTPRDPDTTSLLEINMSFVDN